MKRRGLNLLEVVLAGFIFAAVLAGLAASWRSHEVALRRFRDGNSARLLLQLGMEQFLSKGFNNLNRYAEYLNDPVSFPPAERDAFRNELIRDVRIARSVDAVRIESEYHLETTVSRHNADETLLDVRTTITYVDRGAERKLSVESTVFRSE
jgi:hypothetical protein